MGIDLNSDERVAIWTVSKRWRKWYIFFFSVSVLLTMGFITWHEVWVKDNDSATITILAIGQHASPMLISLAIGNIVFVDLLRLLKHGRDVILMLSDLVIDAVRKHKARKATLVSEQKATLVSKQRERDQDWNTALEAAGLTPEQKARIGEALARKHDGKEEKPA